MQSNRRSGTKPERALASELHRRGRRFRRDVYWKDEDAGVRTYIDIVFTARCVAVYVDGCAWHGCLEHPFAPKTNSAYWASKIDRNAARDRRIDAALRKAGWTVLRVWEHEDVVPAADRVEAALREARTVDRPGLARGASLSVATASTERRLLA
jgi:DNA mismatch endonuclease (patch repair protein)